MKPTSPLIGPLVSQVFDVKRTKGETRKIKIMEAVIECLATRGLEETTFEAIGKLVKMERTHVTYYFPNRKELIMTAVRYAVAIGQQITIGHVQKAKTWKERLKAVIEGPFEWIEKYPKHAPVMAFFYYLCSYDKDYRELQAAIQSGGEERLAATLQSLVDARKLSPAKATDLARTIQAHMAGTLHLFYSCDYPLTLKQLKTKTVEHAMALVEAAL